jgi:hypothetical protein
MALEIKEDSSKMLLKSGGKEPSLIDEAKKYFLLISSGRELHKTREVRVNNGTLHFHSDVCKILTFDTNDKIFFKLFDAMNPPICVSQAVLTPQTVLF